MRGMKVFTLVLACSVWFLGSFASSDSDPIKVDKVVDPVGNLETPTTPIIDVESIHKEAEAAAEPAKIFTLDELKAFSIKNLREFLSVRGLECKGCSEKDDYVKMTYDNQHLPIVPKQPPVNPSTGELPPDGSKIDPKELEELMRKMKSNGFGNSRFFSPSDLEGLSPEEMADKINGKPSSSRKSKSSKSKSSKKSSNKKDNKKDSKKDNTDESSTGNSEPKKEKTTKSSKPSSKSSKSSSRKSKKESNSGNKKDDNKDKKSNSFVEEETSHGSPDSINLDDADMIEL